MFRYKGSLVIIEIEQNNGTMMELLHWLRRMFGRLGSLQKMPDQCGMANITAATVWKSWPKRKRGLATSSMWRRFPTIRGSPGHQPRIGPPDSSANTHEWRTRHLWLLLPVYHSWLSPPPMSPETTVRYGGASLNTLQHSQRMDRDDKATRNKKVSQPSSLKYSSRFRHFASIVSLNVSPVNSIILARWSSSILHSLPGFGWNNHLPVRSSKVCTNWMRIDRYQFGGTNHATKRPDIRFGAKISA